jgi:hypothetical protein
VYLRHVSLMVALFLNASQPFRPRSLRVKLSIKTLQCAVFTCSLPYPTPVRHDFIIQAFDVPDRVQDQAKATAIL